MPCHGVKKDLSTLPWLCAHASVYAPIKGQLKITAITQSKPTPPSGRAARSCRATPDSIAAVSVAIFTAPSPFSQASHHMPKLKSADAVYHARLLLRSDHSAIHFMLRRTIHPNRLERRPYSVAIDEFHMANRRTCATQPTSQHQAP